MSFLPLLLIPILIYNLVAPFGIRMTVPIVWVLSLEDILTTFALIVLGLELWRSTAPTLRTARHQVANLMLVLAVLEMAIVPWCRSGTFFTLTLASLITLIDATFVAFITKGTNVLLSNR